MTSTPDSLRGAPFTALLSRLGLADPREARAALWSFSYFFSVLCAYYIIRPLRDEMGVAVGKDRLEALFTIVFVVMLAAVPLFGWVVATFAKRRVVPIVYAFFILNLAGFWVLFSAAPKGATAASAFFVWVSVFNLFVVSLFWSFNADVYTTEQAKRLYGFIAAGGSAGALAGPLLTQSLVKIIGPTNMLLVSVLWLGIALVCAAGLARAAAAFPARAANGAGEKPTGDGLLAGALHVLRSPYLRNIALWVLVANVVSTFFYFEQAGIVGKAIAEPADRVQLFARMDLTVSLLTIAAQLFTTSRLIQYLGLGASAASVAIVAVAGLAALAISPTLWVIVAVIVAERAIHFALSNPSMRVLYTVVAPEDKFKAQNFVDTVVYRGGDMVAGWLVKGLGSGLGFSVSQIALLAIPFAGLWAGLSFVLGHEQAALEKANAEKAKPGT